MKEWLNRIILGDCLEVMRTMPDKCVDLVLTDPPYGHGGDSQTEGRFGNKGSRFEKYRPVSRTSGTWAERYEKKIASWDKSPTQEVFDELFRVSKHQIIWGGNYFNLPPTRCFNVWRKLTISEKFTMAMCEYAWTSFNDNAKFWEYMPQDSCRFHPTQKPVDLIMRQLEEYAEPGMVIFDPFSGSGTTAIACHKLGLDFICCERDAEYHAASVARLEKERAQGRLELFAQPKWEQASLL
jgi:site-specific DNA-methyltransferase (adenine-specific)